MTGVFSATGVALAAITVSAAATPVKTIDAGPFSVDVGPRLAIRYQGKTLLSGDRCVAFRGLVPNAPVLVDSTQGRVVRKDNVFTVTARKGRNSLRREIMVTPEAVHITYEIRVLGRTGGSHIQYDLLAPAETLNGTPYDVWAGLARRPLKKSSGTFSTKQTKPFRYLVQTARYFVVKLRGGECSIDFNPGGLWQGESNYGDNFSTSPYHDGKRFHFAMLCAGGRFGGIFSGKVVIRAGGQPHEALHSSAPVEYHIGFPVSLALNFSENDSQGPFQACPVDVPAGKPFGWRNPRRIRIIRRGSGGLLYRDFATAADGKSDGWFEMQMRDGLYLLTINAYDSSEAVGPFTVSGPDGVLFKDVVLKPGSHWFKSAPLRFRGGAARLRFSGKWKINALSLQPILYASEDFIFERSFWNMKIAE